MTRRLAVFDCDGTLVDGQAPIIHAMEDCFGHHRLVPPDRHAIRRIVGLSLPQAMRVLLPEGDEAIHLALTERFKQAFQGLRSDGRVDEPLYAGVAEALDELAERGWLLGVATGKSDRGLAFCLAAHGLSNRFVTLQTADRHPSKPHPSMLHAAMAEAGATPRGTTMIGDTHYDMIMGVSAGARAVGVDWGYHTSADLIEAGACEVAGDVADLVRILEDPWTKT